MISEMQNGISAIQRREKHNQRDLQQQAGGENSEAVPSGHVVAAARKDGSLRNEKRVGHLDGIVH